MSEPTHKRISLNRSLWLLLIPGLLGAGFVYYLWSLQPDPGYWKGLMDEGMAFLEAHPSALILSLMLLPGIGFPISPILILFGAVLAPRYGMFNTCLMGISAQAICSIWSYWLAAGPLREILQRFVLRNRPLPELTHKNAWQIGILLRITPGIPYVLQNIALGVMRLPFLIYLCVSISIQGAYATGFIVSGGAIFNGRIGLAITGGIFLVVIILVTRIYFSRRKTDNG